MLAFQKKSSLFKKVILKLSSFEFIKTAGKKDKRCIHTGSAPNLKQNIHKCQQESAES